MRPSALCAGGSTRYVPAIARAALLALLLAAAGCATLDPPGGGPSAPVPAVEGDPAFELTGRLAIRQGEQAVSAGLRWRYDGASEEMVISGPLGAGSAELTRDAGGVVFRSGGRVQQSTDAESLMRSVLGFALPLDGLRYWVRGQPGPGERAVRVERDAQGRLASFFEAGWQVSIAAYSPAPLAALPRRIDVQSSELTVRLVIDQWLDAPVAAQRPAESNAAPR